MRVVPEGMTSACGRNRSISRAGAPALGVTMAVTGSAPSTPEFFEQMHRLFPNAETANSWGTTESGPLGFGPHPDGIPKPMGALGYPRAGIEVKFVGGAETGASDTFATQPYEHWREALAAHLPNGI